MPLRTPTKREIVERIVLHVLGRGSPLSDFTTISNLRILLEEMVGEELLRLYAGLAADFRQWFLQTATGENLDRRLADYGVSRPGAVAASGTVLFSATVDASVPVVVPAGTRVRTQPVVGAPALTYSVVANPARVDGAWLIDYAGSGIEASVVADLPGAAGNVPAGAIAALESAIAGVQSVGNLKPLAGGKDTATDSEAFEYFTAFLAARKTGSRSAILFDLLNYVDASGLRPVRSASIEEWGGQTLLDAAGRPVALKIYVDLVETATIQAVQQLVDGTDVNLSAGLRAAGVPAAVVAALRVPFDVRATIDVDRAYTAETVRSQVEDVIFAHLARLPVGGVRLSGEPQGQFILARLVSDVQDVPGVLRVTFERPTTDVSHSVGTKIDPGEISVSVASVT